MHRYMIKNMKKKSVHVLFIKWVMLPITQNTLCRLPYGSYGHYIT